MYKHDEFVFYELPFLCVHWYAYTYIGKKTERKREMHTYLPKMDRHLYIWNKKK